MGFRPYPDPYDDLREMERLWRAALRDIWDNTPCTPSERERRRNAYLKASDDVALASARIRSKPGRLR